MPEAGRASGPWKYFPGIIPIKGWRPRGGFYFLLVAPPSQPSAHYSHYLEACSFPIPSPASPRFCFFIACSLSPCLYFRTCTIIQVNQSRSPSKPSISRTPSLSACFGCRHGTIIGSVAWLIQKSRPRLPLLPLRWQLDQGQLDHLCYNMRLSICTDSTTTTLLRPMVFVFH